MIICPKCGKPCTSVIETRTGRGPVVRRRRECPACKTRTSTIEATVPDGFPSGAAIVVHKEDQELLLLLVAKVIANTIGPEAVIAFLERKLRSG